MNFIYFLIILFFGFIASAQNDSIKIKDFNSKLPLKEVYIYIEPSGVTKLTNEKGEFVLDRSYHLDTLKIYKTGFKTLIISPKQRKQILYLKRDTDLSQLSEITIDASERIDVNSVEVDQIKFSAKEIDKQPFILGEKDVFKLLQLTPGVQQGKEGQSGFLVRGGNPSMNLTLLDQTYLHNTSHLGGIFTAINSDLIKNVTFSKSAFDAQYGGRLSSVMSINTKNSTDSAKRFSGGIGFLSAKLTGNIDLDSKTSLLFSGRRTYLELFKPFFKKSSSILSKDKNYYFYDYLVSLKTRFNKKSDLSVFVYNTKDDFEDFSKNRNRHLEWGNLISGLTWKYNFTDFFRMQTNLSSSNYSFVFSDTQYPYKYSFKSYLDVLNLKQIYSKNIGEQLLTFGFEVNDNKIKPKEIDATLVDTPLNVENQATLEYTDFSLFSTLKYKINAKTKLKLGLRFVSVFSKKNELLNETYFYNIEPRFSLNHKLNDDFSLKMSYQYLYQYVHQASVTSFSLPLDFLLVSTNELKPQKASMFTLGAVWANDLFKLTTSGYFNYIKDYTEFQNGALNSLFSNNIYDDTVQGELQSYGVEIGIKGKWNKINYSLSGTFSKTLALFDEINDGIAFNTSFDRPLSLNGVFSYKLSDRIELGAVLVYSSGQTYTPPEDIRIIDEESVINYGIKNSSRYPSYHRLDLSSTYKFKTKPKFSSKLNLTIYNVYNRNNPFFVNYNVENTDFGQTIEINKEIEGLFPILPTLNWMFSF